MHTKIQLSRSIAGFAVSDAKKGEEVEVQTIFSLTSQHPNFKHYARQIHDLFISKIHPFPGDISKYLIIIHTDLSADIYINDFSDDLNVQVKNGLSEGEPIYLENIEKFNQVTFPDVEIKETDTIIYSKRINWDFLLFFDATAQHAGKHDNDYKEAIAQLEEQLRLGEQANEIKSQSNEAGKNKCLILTEGKTDVMHLESAKRKLGIKLPIVFSTDGKEGDESRLAICGALALIEQKNKIIFIFDADNKKVLKKLKLRTEKGKEYQKWGNNVFSFAIPFPDHRKTRSELCLEFYYTDEELRIQDENGKRLYFSNELRKEIMPNGKIIYRKIEPCKELEHTNKIHDGLADEVIDQEDQHVCLSKAKFAEYIQGEHPNFKGINFSSFKNIFDIIQEIIEI